MSHSDVDASFPVDLPSLRPSSQLSNFTNMVALITLTLKLGEIANEMYVLAPAAHSFEESNLHFLDHHCGSAKRASSQAVWRNSSHCEKS